MLPYIKYAVLWLLALAALCLCSVVVMQIMDILFHLQLGSVVGIGIQVGFIAWLLLSVGMVIRKSTQTKK